MSTLGGDPEVFLVDGSGQLVSSIGRIGGDKGNGVPISEQSKRYKWLEDNVSVEFNFPASANSTSFHRHVRDMITYAKEALRKQRLNIKILPHAEFPRYQLLHDKAQVFGCEPDFEAYTFKDNKAPEPRIVDVGSIKNERFAGGHIHLGFNNKHKIPAHAVAILCDMYLGLPSVCLDDQGPRREVYGRAGLYRPKPYGIEYRTMSNWWLEYDLQHHMRAMADEAFVLMECLESAPDELAYVFDKVALQDVRTVINSQNIKEAWNLWMDVRGYTRSKSAVLGDLTGYFTASSTSIVRSKNE